jgi:pimeloyl-ACP methyl ester carboxylesterase
VNPSGVFADSSSELGQVVAAAALARDVYADREEWIAQRRAAGWDHAELLGVGATQVGWAFGPEALVVVPRGSDDARDWLGNVQACLVPCPKQFGDGHIHAGFLRQLERVPPALYGILRDAMHALGERPVHVLGHSLGGGLAPAIAFRLLAEGIRIAGVHLFGAPRLGDAAFAATYNRHGLGAVTRRFVRCQGGEADLVTRVPLSSAGYCHLGQVRLLEQVDSAWRLVAGEDAWQSYRARHPVSRLRALRVVSRLRRGARAHSAAGYAEALAAIAANPKE